jgi:hypothetical protein
MVVHSRSAAAVALAAVVSLSAACNPGKGNNPLGPMEIRVMGSPERLGGPSRLASANRTPDPVQGERLPLPDMSAVVARVAAEHPDALRASCGSWEFMDLVVDELRRHDTRWGYNWKRGNVGDPSHDVVDYHWAGGVDEGSTDVYIVDVINGHCGDNPAAGWSDVTDATYHGGAIGRWTGRGRF